MEQTELALNDEIFDHLKEEQETLGDKIQKAEKRLDDLKQDKALVDKLCIQLDRQLNLEEDQTSPAEENNS